MIRLRFFTLRNCQKMYFQNYKFIREYKSGAKLTKSVHYILVNLAYNYIENIFYEISPI